MARTKIKAIHERELELLILIKEVSKKYPEVSNRKIDVDRYCNDCNYRKDIKYKLTHIEERRRRSREYQKIDRQRNPERYAEYHRRHCQKHPWCVKENFDRWAISNPRKAMLTAATSRMAKAVIARLWIRPTVCPHCGRERLHIDFHHPNHLFRWKWTFCCKSCHYFFNRDRVPSSDKIIDLKQLLRESLSH